MLQAAIGGEANVELLDLEADCRAAGIAVDAILDGGPPGMYDIGGQYLAVKLVPGLLADAQIRVTINGLLDHLTIERKVDRLQVKGDMAYASLVDK